MPEARRSVLFLSVPLWRRTTHHWRNASRFPVRFVCSDQSASECFTLHFCFSCLLYFSPKAESPPCSCTVYPYSFCACLFVFYAVLHDYRMLPLYPARYLYSARPAVIRAVYDILPVYCLSSTDTFGGSECRHPGLKTLFIVFCSPSAKQTAEQKRQANRNKMQSIKKGLPC